MHHRLAAAFLAISSTAAAQDVSALLLTKTQAFSDAGQQGNASVLRALLDDNVVFFNENGEQATKADLVESATPQPTPSAVKMTVSDWHCAVHGDTAVASFIDDQVRDLHGQMFHAQYRSVETWLKEKDGWRMIGSHTMALQSDPPAMVLPSPLLDQYAGTYQATPTLKATFVHDGTDLTISTNGSAPVVQKAELRDVFFTAGVPRIRRIFLRDARGNISGFVSRREGHDIVFKRVEQG